MFGAYQAGVWEALHDRFTPDLVVGASIGSVNGYLIACGVPPTEITRRWLSLDQVEKLRWRPSLRLNQGLLDPTLLNTYLQQVCAAAPRCEYALVTTETRTGRQRLFQSPGVTWQHIAASCGVPLFLPTHKIDGVYHSDGGLIDPLPLWAALQLGATEIVSVDVLKHRPLPVRALVRVLRAYAGYRPPSPEGIRVVEISPAQRLGTARDSMYWSRKNAEYWIEAGRKDGRAPEIVMQL
jgi:predicted acylesterase/phospholipase RssA